MPSIARKEVTIIPFGSNGDLPQTSCDIVQFYLISQYKQEPIKIQALVVPNICADTLPQPCWQSLNFNCRRIADKNGMGESQVDGVSVLIGADCYWKVVTGEIEKLTKNLNAINTKLGWTLKVPIKNLDENVYVGAISVLNTKLKLPNIWDLETIGIKEDWDTNFVKEYTETSINKENDRYVIKLPWKLNKNDLHDNYKGAKLRLVKLTRNLQRDGKLIEYNNAIMDYLKQGVAEVISSENSMTKYYLPHRAVYREDKDTTKLCIVFDASAHEVSIKSLNEMLHQGSNLMPNLLKILYNFRIGKIGLIADIEKAFLQIELAKEDRDVHRFLWYENGLTCSPFILTAT